jgi:16S rRNA (uracil1498-N3)-methyltransferase
MASSIRLFVAARLHAGAHIEATRAQAHYLRAVMRREPGDPVLLFNGEDGEWLAHLSTLRRDSAGIVADRRLRPQAAEPDLWLLFAPLKRDATELIVQKATELGVAVLKPVLTGRSNRARLTLARLFTIAIEAAEQSERLTVPRIDPPCRLDELLGAWPAARKLVVAVERGTAPPVPAVQGSAALLVGPEGGFTERELDALTKLPIVTRVGLGPRVLRAETAAVAALAVFQAIAGDWRRNRPR